MTHFPSARYRPSRSKFSSGINHNQVRTRCESLEPRLMLSVNMTAYEQLLIELINKARANPADEVAELAGVSLNQGLSAGTITNTPKQPLAPHQSLRTAAVNHSQDMLDNDYFSHTNLSNQSPSDRAMAAGYGAGAGENIAWAGSTGSIDELSMVHDRHAGLLLSPGHRNNLMLENYREVGTGIRFGDFTTQGMTFNAIMVTENFGSRGGNAFITGVAYSDALVDDDFYSVGEGAANVLITATDVNSGVQFSVSTGSAGGYALQVPNGTYDVTAEGGDIDGVLTQEDVVVSGQNVKVDVVTTEVGTQPDPDDPPPEGETPANSNGVGIAGLTGGQWWVAASTGLDLANSTWGNWSDAVQWRHIHAADFDGDGQDDIVGQTNGRWWVARSEGSSFTTESWGVWTNRFSWQDVSVGDVNGDGRADILGRTPTGSWWVGLSDGQSFINQNWAKWTDRFEWEDVQVADFNGDGRDDIAGRSSANGSWWVGSSTGTSFTTEHWGNWTTRQDWNSIRTGDLNGDGRDDLVGRLPNGTWWLAESTGQAFVSRRFTSWSNNARWSDIRVGDLDGDGRDDLIGRTNGQWWVSRTVNTDVVNEQWGNWDPFADWDDVVLIDIDRDGMDDVIGRNANDWWVGRSNGQQLNSSIWGQWNVTEPWDGVVAGLFVTPS